MNWKPDLIVLNGEELGYYSLLSAPEYIDFFLFWQSVHIDWM
jgi:hypothetical protein